MKENKTQSIQNNTQKDWEIEFDKQFSKYNGNTKIWKDGILKHFISQLLSKELAEQKERADDYYATCLVDIKEENIRQGERSLAEGILERIKNGKNLNYIKTMCSVIKK